MESKRAFIIMLVLTIVFFAGAGVLGYLYYKQSKTIENLSSQNEELQKQNESSASDLDAQTQALQEQIDNYKTKTQKANAYNEFFKYLNSVIKTHNGFAGWTDAEYKKGKTLAQATGDSSFVTKVDWAWNEQSIDPNTRMIAIWEAIASGIEKNLK